MSDTTDDVPSAEKLCTECGAPVAGDKRYAKCASCRGVTVANAPTISDSTDTEIQPLRIPVERSKPIPAVPRDYYWCGCTEDAPSHNLTAGGISFPLWNGKVVEKAPGKFEYIDRIAKGQVNHLTDATVALVLERAAEKVVRNGSLLSIKGSPQRPFIPQQGDIPLGEYMYMIKVRNRDDRPFQDPPTLIPRS